MAAPLWQRVLLGALLATPVALRAQGAQLQSFRDWAVGCDATRHCTAVGMSPADHATIGFLHLERTPSPNAELRAQTGWWNAERQSSGPVTIVLTGPRHDTLARDVVPPPRDDDYRLIAFDSVQTRRLVETTRTSELLVVLSRAGDTLGVVSLRGFTATLLAMDAAQRRLGTTTSLVRRGARPASAVPPSPVMRQIRARPYTGTVDVAADSMLARAARQRLGTRMGSDCDEPDGDTWDSASPLDGRRHLVGLMCGRGAYNVWFRWFIVTDRNVGAARAASFVESPSSGGVTPADDLVNAVFDPGTGTMGAFAKARGLGDCGVMSTWAWDGTRFVLAERRELHECRGVMSDWWPVTTRRLVVR